MLHSDQSNLVKKIEFVTLSPGAKGSSIKMLVVTAPSDLQAHYGNGLLGNVYLLALDNNIARQTLPAPHCHIGSCRSLGAQSRKLQLASFYQFL